ncbi:MAG TPA: alpha/beta fold hydrolase, partial [Steroidobacteraceae bacterium]|nr:alpha/beta fold hydrolase [Steroidobacteraceae bacterium]
AVPQEVLRDFASSLRIDHARTVQNFLALQTRGDEQAASTLRLMRRQLESHGPPDPRALAAGLEILGSADLRDRIGTIAVPALIAAGESDRLTPPGAALALAQAMPQARLALLPRCAHAPFLSHPDAFLAELRPFLDRCAASAAPGRIGCAT